MRTIPPKARISGKDSAMTPIATDTGVSFGRCVAAGFPC